MDRQTMALLIPIAALAIPTAAIVMNGLMKIARMRLEEARIRAGGPADGLAELAALREEVGDLRHELTEVHERLDFTERVLARQREERLSGGP
jgi:hypothetical protein